MHRFGHPHSVDIGIRTFSIRTYYIVQKGQLPQIRRLICESVAITARLLPAGGKRGRITCLFEIIYYTLCPGARFY